MISIDFVAGSHGSFLEFVCNKYIIKIPYCNFLPFNNLGASHQKTTDYIANKVFTANHFSLFKIPVSKKVIRITFTQNDLLILSSVSFLRAGNVGIDNDLLEENTYHKLNSNKFYTSLLNRINLAYPNNIISPSSPNCPRYILREFFKYGFQQPDNHGLYLQLKQLSYPVDVNVIDFPFNSFYNYNLFLNNLIRVADWCNETIDQSGLQELWTMFIGKQIYKDHKKECDEIVETVLSKQGKPMKKLSLFQESYINATLEKLFNKEMPFVQPLYFQNTNQIIKHLCLK